MIVSQACKRKLVVPDPGAISGNGARKMVLYEAVLMGPSEKNP